ncbi:hypothetical protein HG530_002698 [Fusarium avenaceum]|nr:hypothetical protein HG530_002698 [Fusarium avenaceum]
MEPSSSPKHTEDAGSSPQSHTSLRFAPIERPVTPPASLAKEKDSTPDDTGTEEARGPVPNEAAVSPVDKSRVSPPANSSTRQLRPRPCPRPRQPLHNSPIRRRGYRPRNSQIRRRGACLKQRNDRSSNERHNTRVIRRILPRLGASVNQRNNHSSNERQNTGGYQQILPRPGIVPLIVKKPTTFLVFPIRSITSPDDQNLVITPQCFLFHTMDVPTPPTIRGGPKGTLELILRTSPYEPDFMPDWRVNDFWKHNVERVLGREIRDNWPNMMALIHEAKASFLEEGSPLIQRRWNPAETEIAARLKAWRMPDFVVGYLIGQPPRHLGIIDSEQVVIWGLDEMNRIDAIHGMGLFGNSEEEEEVADGSDQVG